MSQGHGAEEHLSLVPGGQGEKDPLFTSSPRYVNFRAHQLVSALFELEAHLLAAC